MVFRSSILHCVLLAAACGSKTSASAPSMMPATTPILPPGATMVLSAEGDLDGRPGNEQLTLYGDGTIIAGNWMGKVDVDAGSEYFRGAQAHLSVEVLDRGKGIRVLVVALPTEEDEDPPNHYQVLAPRGAELVEIYDETLGVYGVTELRFPGDGTVHYVEDSWTACGSPQGGATETSGDVPIHDVTLALDAGGKLAVSGRKPTGKTFNCGELAACPWIYVDGPAGPVRVGEILRDVRGRAAYTRQDLALPAAAAGPLRVRVAEEEDEVTFLDEIYVEVDGVRMAPAACNAAAPPAYCVADHQPLRMARGAVLELTFDLPAASTPTVFARGYYVPTPSRAKR